MLNREERLPILAHLEELRKRVLYSVIALAIGFFVSFQYSEYLLSWMQIPLTLVLKFQGAWPYVYATHAESPTRLVFLAPAEAFWMYMKIAFVAGIFFSLPVILTQIWLFVAPGLLPRERRYALPFVVLSTMMFVLGALFCQYVILPFAVRFLLTYQTKDLTPMISVGNYVDFCSKFLLAFGLVFELPLVITLLSKMGLVTPQFLSRHRKYAVLLSFIAAALLTPTPDVFNQLLMAVPILVLYEVGIIMARLVGRKKALPAPEAEGE
ncbi:MAG TPA: twin-arginine translocase subunit TatC [Nitrospirota bacterium]|nr:twin-arginine translocase subunit TatC [Nitrospirota bacterium]